MIKEFENSVTIDEKIKYYSKHTNIDYSFINDWRDCKTLLNDKYFKQMLVDSQYSYNEFSFAVQPLNISLTTIEQEWEKNFKTIINGFTERDIDINYGVSILSIPFIKYFKEKLLSLSETLKGLKVEEAALTATTNFVLEELFNVFGKIFALKLAEFKVNNNFNTVDKNKRLKEVLLKNLSSKSSFIDIYKEYPVATRIATMRTMFAINNFSSLFSRLEKDSSEIKKFLNKNELSLTNISVSQGDSHEQGNSVMILHFENSKLVYKPKNLEISTVIEKFVSWYVDKSELLSLKFPKGIFKEQYTYSEFIQPKACINVDEINNFYLRYGYLVAICYLFNLNDLHMENIIAQGEHPVIIDLETIFQIAPKLENDSVSAMITKKIEAESIKNSCLLPRGISIGLDEKVELSAFNGVEVKLPNQFVTPVNTDTDDFHYEKRDGYFKGGENIPTKDTSKGIVKVDYEKYRLRVLEGFDDFMSFIIKNKDELMKFMNKFEDYQVRALLKGTERYASLLRYSNHPIYNKKMKYRERLFMNSWAYPYFDKKIVKSEVRDLLFNDIPIFYMKTGSRDLIDSHGLVYRNYFEKSGLDVSLEKIKKLDIREINFQKNILLTCLNISDTYFKNKSSIKISKWQDQSFSYVKEAKRIGDYLIDQSLEYKGEVSFINIDCDQDYHWNLLASDESLYSGTSGISIFFLELFRHTKVIKYYEMYKKIMATSVSQAKFHAFESAFQGWLAPIYPLLLEYSYFGTICEKEFLDLTVKKINNIDSQRLSEIFKQTDYINGLSGVVCLFYKINNTYAPLGDILGEVEKLLRNRIDTSVDSSLEQVGVAHGISGIIFGIISQKNFDKRLIDNLLLKEISLEIEDKNSLKWCKGIIGQIHCRLNILKYYDSKIARNQLFSLLTSLKYQLKNLNYGKDDSICHGLSGVIMIVKDILDYDNSDEWREILSLCVSSLFTTSLFNCYRLDNLNDIFSKGLLNGIGGVGLTYLYANGDVKNNILSFEI